MEASVSDPSFLGMISFFWVLREVMSHDHEHETRDEMSTHTPDTPRSRPSGRFARCVCSVNMTVHEGAYRMGRTDRTKGQTAIRQSTDFRLFMNGKRLTPCDWIDEAMADEWYGVM